MTINDLFNAAVDNSTARKEAKGVIGYLGTSATYQTKVPGNQGLVYVRMSTGNGGFGGVISHARSFGADATNMPVTVENTGGVLDIKSPDRSRLSAYNPSGNAYGYGLPKHSHQIGQGNVDPVEGMRFLPGNVHPVQVNGTYGLDVYIEPFFYKYNNLLQYWPGRALSVSSLVPASANQQAWIVCGVDPITNVGTARANTAVTLATSLEASQLSGFDFGTNIPLGAVKLQNAQTAIADIRQFIDLRVYAENTLDSAGGTGSTTFIGLTDVPASYTNAAGALLSVNAAETALEYIGLPALCQGRLTLTSGTPITTSDVTAATTLYYTPYNGDQIALYDGSLWRLYTFTEKSISLSGKTADTNYDVFIYDNSGTLTLELVAWSSSGAGTSARATAITLQNGVYVKSGATTHRYLGTLRITSAGGQCEDSKLKRLVWNMHNRTSRQLRATQNSTHTYATATFRYWNNSSANRVDFVLGLADAVPCFFEGDITNTSATGFGYVGLGDDAPANAKVVNEGNAQNVRVRSGASYAFDLAVGYHFVCAVEYASSATISADTYRMTGLFVG